MRAWRSWRHFELLTPIICPPAKSIEFQYNSNKVERLNTKYILKPLL